MRLATLVAVLPLSCLFNASAATLYVDLNCTNPTPPYASWATAARTIQDAVNTANVGDLVLVTNGLYQAGGQIDDYYGNDLTNRVAIPQPLTVQSVNGPSVTTILGNPTLDGNAVRCVEMAEGATLSGFTLKNGGTAGFTYWGWATGYTGQQSGGGVYSQGPGAVVTNCVITGCAAYYYGGGAFNGILKNCTLTNNLSGFQGGGANSCALLNCSLINNQSGSGGGGAEGGSLTNCLLFGNTALANGGGAEGSALANCALAGNSAQGSGGGLSGGSANNCTFTANTALGNGGGADANPVNNCILFYNSAPNGANFSFGSVLNYCCTTPVPDHGSNSFVADPLLQDSVHLQPGSPCVGAGNFGDTSGVDIDGQAWLNPPSIGCAELSTGAAFGPLSLAIQSAFTNVAAGFPASFKTVIYGHATNLVWNFGDGTFATNQLWVAHRWAAPGSYTLSLTAFNDSVVGGASVMFTVHVAAQPVLYVNAANTSPSYPFTSWAGAATNIQDAVDAVVTPGTMVLVTNGIYRFGGRTVAGGSLTNRVAINLPMLVQSVNGPAVTTIAGYPVIGDNATRCVYLANGAQLTGFTLTQGATRNAGDVTWENSGGGIRCESVNTIVSNCVISGNLANNFGGGIEGGTVLNCLLSSNTANSGGGVHGVVMANSTLWLNAGGENGGGAESCVVRNSALTANTVQGNGGAADNSELFSSTISGNTASAGGGVNNSKLINSIVYFNTAPIGSNYLGSSLGFCDTAPLPANGSSNLSADPQLTDNAHLGPTSPCRGRGDAAVAAGTDIDGDAWANPPSIGCDEYNFGAVLTPLQVAVLANYTNVCVGFPVDLSALIGGHATSNSWSFGDGVVVSNQVYVTHSWANPGDYLVTLTAFNDANPEGISATLTVRVTSQTVFYVDATGTNPAAPFDSWATAATNIQDAADVAGAGSTILVNDGFYQYGGRVVFGLLTNRVALVRPIQLQSVNGPAATIIAGNPVNDDTAVRGVLLVNGCAISGFTVTNGATRSAGDSNLEQSGGGIWCESAFVSVSNCVLAANSASQYGGGAQNGTFENCAFTGNYAGAAGGGCYQGSLVGCVFSANNSGNTGGGADSSTLSNCTLTANSASSAGGGANGCALNDCLIATNYIDWGNGGGVSGCTLSNCDLIANNSPITAGGAEGSTLTHCRLIANEAGSEGGGGGGADHCSLTSCLLAGNSIYSVGGGASESTLEDCTLTNNYASLDGGGAFDCVLTNCVLAANSAGGYGGGACVGTIHNCVLSGNLAGISGGAYSGFSESIFANGISISNSALYANAAAQNGGAVESCVAVNCTLTGNSAGQSGGGADNSTLANCIVYSNSATNGANYVASTLNYCCALPLPALGVGNITNQPQLADFMHLSAGSPCRGAGSAADASGVDIDGEPWLNPPSMGCDEFYPGSATGSLAVAISAAYTNCASGFLVNFAGQISGHAEDCVWNFGDGTVVSNQLYLTHAWTSGGDYTVSFTAYNESNPGGVTASVVVAVLPNPVYYVALSSATPLPPFNSWATAATNIQDAIDAAVVGGTVLVTNGDYNAGGRVIFGSLTNRIAITKPLTVASVNGPAATLIEGYPVIGDGAVRCAYVTNGATLAGFTLTNGATRADGDFTHEMSGGGALCESVRAVLTNCLVANSSASVAGGGVCQGTVESCLLCSNAVTYFGNGSGGGACGATLIGCVLSNNLSYIGGGAQGCELLQCSLSSNSTYIDSDYTANGGAASGCVLTNCVLSGNSSLTAAGPVRASSSIALCMATAPKLATEYGRPTAAAPVNAHF